MYKSILAILLVGLLAAPIMAQPFGPVPPGGWGNDPCEWDRYGGVCEAVHAIYNPDLEGWYICGQERVDLCQEITVELWIELYACMTVYNLNHYFHAVGDDRARDAMFEFVIEGTTSSNNDLYICMQPGPMQDLNYLAFQENIFGNAEQQPPIPMNWEYIWGRYDQQGNQVPVIDWTGVEPDPNIIFRLPKCDRWWIIRGYFYLWYHIADGYYLLYYAICPSPVL
jgi:hypothetical protein